MDTRTDTYTTHTTWQNVARKQSDSRYMLG